MNSNNLKFSKDEEIGGYLTISIKMIIIKTDVTKHMLRYRSSKDMEILMIRKKQ